MEERLTERRCWYHAFNALERAVQTGAAFTPGSSLELHFHKSHSQAVTPITAISLPGEHCFWKPVSISYKAL